MGLKITKVIVNDFISIGSAQMEFKNGVYLVKGENRDKPDFKANSGESTTISNGAGKTTMFSAVYQGLFNKNSKDSKATVASVNNAYTGKPYKVEVHIEKDADIYIVVNDRNKNKITITKNGDDVSPKGITNQLTYIKNVIGFDFQTFASLTFLNSDSLNSIIDLTNKDNIVYQFFDIEALNKMEKSIKKRKKLTEDERIAITSKLSVLEKQLAVFNSTSNTDLDVLKSQESLLEGRLADVESKYNTPNLMAMKDSISNKGVIMEKYSMSKAQIIQEADALKKQLEKLQKGTCPTCGQKFSGSVKDIEDKLAELRDSYKAMNDSFTNAAVDLKDAQAAYETVIKELDDVKLDIKNSLRNIQVSILVEEDRIAQQQKLQSSLDSLEDERQELLAELPIVEADIKAYDALIAIFKSGAVVNEYLRKYRMLLIRNFKELQKFTTFDIDIKIRVSKGKMTYLFIDDGVEKPFTMLSAGERTRVSLMLLLATLKTIEQLTNVTVNYLVLDELLGVLDEEGINFLKNVLATMRKEKSIYIITHHGEIDDSFADGVIHVIKENNISRVER